MKWSQEPAEHPNGDIQLDFVLSRAIWQQNSGDTTGIQIRGTELRTVSVFLRVWYHSLNSRDCFSRHQGLSRNSSILCFSFTASFYPSERSLLIILICFCFHCFSVYPRLGLTDTALPPHSYCSQKTQMIGQELSALSPRDQQCFPTWHSQQHPPSRASTRDETHYSPSSLPRLRLFNVEPIICGVGFFFFEISFFSHFLNILTQFLMFLPFSGYQSLSGVSSFQTKTTESTNQNDRGGAEKSWAVNSDRHRFRSLLHHMQTL